ncbi:unnamed protein product [Brassica oleracea]
MVSVRLELTLLSKTELPVEVGVKGSVVSKEYASTIAKAFLMSKFFVVDIKEPDLAASADFRARDGGQKDLHDLQCVMINRFY